MKTYTLFILLAFVFSFNVMAQKNDLTASSAKCSKTNGQTISLDRFKGTNLVLYIFGNNIDKWNKPIAALNNLKREYANKNVRIGALTSKTQEEIAKYTKSIDFLMFAKSIDFAVVTENYATKKHEIDPPYVYIIASDGTIYWKGESLKNISGKINKLLNSTEENQGSGTNVYNAKLTGKVARYEDTTPKLDYDDSQGIPHRGITAVNTAGNSAENKQTKKDKQSRIPGQKIKQYEATPGIKSDSRDF